MPAFVADFPAVFWGDIFKPATGHEDSDIVSIIPATLELSTNLGVITPSNMITTPVSQPECVERNRDETIEYELLEVIDDTVLDTPLVTDELIAHNLGWLRNNVPTTGVPMTVAFYQDIQKAIEEYSQRQDTS
jgi:hypothetical protein